MNKLFKNSRNIIFSLSLILSVSNSNVAFAHAPHDVIDTLDISPTYSQNKTVFIIVRNNLLKSQNGGSTWKRIVNGLDNRSTAFSSLAFSPTGNSLYLSSRGVGIYKSQDNGSSWTKINNGLGSLSINLVSTFADQTVFATGSQHSLYKTNNGGISWFQVIKNTIPITAIASSPNSEHKLVGDSRGVLYLSTDGGNIWSQRFHFLNSGAIRAIAISPNFSVDKTFFVGTSTGGIFKTVNGGTSFSAVNTNITDKDIRSLVLSPNYRADATIFASTWHQAVFRSTNGGNTWQKLSQGITTDPQADKHKVPHFKDLKISPTFAGDKTLFLAGFDGLFKSADGGLIWRQMDTLPKKLITGLALSPNYRNDSTVATTTYIGGFYKTINKGVTWTAINKNLLTTRIGDLVFSPNYSVDNTIFSYTYGFILKSIDRGGNWRKINCAGAAAPGFAPSRIVLSPSFASDKTLYFGTQQGRVFRSINSGENCSIIFSTPGKYIRSLAISPSFSTDKTMYISIDTQGVYKTINGGSTWQAINNGLTNKNILELAISPNYQLDKTIFLGTQVGLFKTTNAGQSWLKLPGSTYGGNSFIETVAVSPNYRSDRTVIVHVQGKGLFKSVDGGGTFVRIANNLLINNHALSNMDDFHSTGVPIQFSPSYSVDKTIYGTSQEEIFQSNDGGNTWKIITIPIRENTSSS